jgi:uncharacterized protein YdaL
MNHRFASGWLLAGVLAFSLAGCGGVQDAAGGDAARPSSRGGETLHSELNQFPADLGPVPTERGMDLRPRTSALLESPGLASAAAAAGAPALVLYDDGGAWGWLGELYAIGAGTLASHFGPWVSKPVGQYVAGEMGQYTAVIYVGSTYDQSLPVAFLDDVLAGTTPVVWLYNNIWQLANRAPTFAATYGFNPWYYDTSTVASVQYKGIALTRYAANGSGIMLHSALDTTKARVLAQAVRSNGTTFPWAVRSRNLTYVGEIPFAYITETDRYLAFSDILFDVFQPTAPVRHRALVRIEDVTPMEDPAALRAIADYLSAQRVPFSVALVPVYTDPRGVYNGGVAQTVRLRDAPTVVSALAYMVSKGGTLILHGYTHQFSNVNNPYNGVSADDFEFFAAHVDAQNNVVLDGPVPGDSAQYASGRVAAGLAEIAAAKLPTPRIFEFPHYAGSGVDARAIRSTFSTAYHRGLYFRGALTGGPDDTSRIFGQFFPYTVTDVYGWKVIPENIGNYEPVAYNNHPARLPADLVRAARANLAVRDGVASFYFHPYYPISNLRSIVSGVKSAGYTFVSPSSL